MRTEHLYRLHWEYRRRWRITAPPGTHETIGFAYVEGMVEGKLTGRFHGTNHARGRSDDRFLSDVQGAIETTDGITVMFDYQGYGCPYPRNDEPLEDRTRVMIAARHWSDHPSWEFLNDSIAIGIGENRFTDDGVRLLILDVHEVLWEPLVGGQRSSPNIPDHIAIEAQPFDLESVRAQRRSRAAEPPAASPPP